MDNSPDQQVINVSTVSCDKVYCDETLNICRNESYMICFKHCQFENHGHCTGDCCSETINMCKDTSLCPIHCESSDHNQCSEYFLW